MRDDNRIAGELLGLLDDLIKGCETLDLDLAYGMFSRSPGFLMMGTDGSLCGFDSFYENDRRYLSQCTRFALTTRKAEVRVIDAGTAVLAWSYRAEAELENGTLEIVDDAGASLVFARGDDGWKVKYYHQSSGPFRRVPASA